MNRWAVVFCLLAVTDAHICHIYEQKLRHGALDLNDVPMGVLMATDCDSCVAVKESNKLIVGCMKTEFSPQLLQAYSRPSCPAGTGGLACEGNICCCRTDSCFDELRAHFSSQKPSGTTCPVYRQAFDNFGRLANISVPAGKRFVRKTCAVCNARKDSTGVEFECIEGGDTDRICKDKKNFVGGDLACDKLGKSCCCKGTNCERDYRNFFSRKPLPPPSLKKPYSAGARSSIALLAIAVAFVSFFQSHMD
ncbi:hypothetical protein QR680_008500 [Steinernema hermaphroditum]|uniref:Uncharacterized protein n=1 Tax=Steinernema hermaphroditum TaxID=289476 RepID=A0AA39IJ11_9BILA|nr:hypothetical protein QR680_008500 [Steinernema hermaphroditum]